MEEVLVPILVVGMLFIGLPWVIFHYITKWKSMKTITNEDEHLLEDLYQMARRLDDRMETVERIIRADDPDWRPHRLTSRTEDNGESPLANMDRTLDRFDRIMEERNPK